MTKKLFDSIIVGGGPAGLSAAVYLGRFLRETVVIDGGAGRSSGPQINENYLGFPRGIKASKLRQLGRQQAERFNVKFVSGTASVATREKDGFTLSGDCGEWRARTIILASGVTDVWPSFPGVERYIGKSLFWCITCDGFRTRGKRLLLIGADDEAAITACQFLTFTDKLLFVAAATGDSNAISKKQLKSLADQSIAVVDGAIERVKGVGGQVNEVVIAGKSHKVDLIFSLFGEVPNSQLAAQLGVLLDEKGYVKITDEQRTNVAGVYAAGDLSGPYAHQVSSAVHEGATAAQAINYDLYADFQQE
ncbi:MAG: NAD(P)/FAD-dependent oxidoreductase [Solirubrobacteraceae bacterium]